MIMKRIPHIFIAILLALTSIEAHTYTNTSLLSTGKFVKIAVAETGICRLTYDEIKNMGLNPTQVRVLGFGGGMLTQDFTKSKIDDLPTVPFYMHKGSDNTFNSGDYILFYAQGPISWEYTGSRFRHTVNPYSMQGFYFLSDNVGEQKFLTQERTTIEATGAHSVTTFSDYRLHEIDKVNLIDKSGLSGGGREWYGECFTQRDNTLSIPFDIPDIVSTVSIRAYVDVANTSTQKPTLSIQIGKTTNVLTATAKSSDHIEKARVSYLDKTYTPNDGSTQNVNLRFSATSASDELYLNYVELTAARKLNLINGILFARNAEHYKSSTPSIYTVTNATEETQVWDVTQLDAIQLVPTQLQGSELSFVLDNNKIHELVIINPTKCATISPVDFRIAPNGEKLRYLTVPNQNLHNLRDVDMVIITPQSFYAAATELAAAHEELDNLATAVVTDQQVYNEFSSGTPDATAYRWLIKMLYDRGINGGKRPSYLLLFGDGTYDNRKILTVSGTNTLLTYQAKNSTKETSAYSCDDYFTWMEDREGNNDILATMDLSVGRLPVNTPTEAQQVVNKYIRYMRNETAGTWKNQLLFLADDGDGNMHTRGVDKAAEAVRKNNPNFVVNKIYLDSYQQESTASGESYPLAKSKFDNLMKSGVLLFDYCGHAGYNNITSENILTAREVREMTNQNLGVWVLATCNFANFDAQKTSAAEEAVLNENGGALAVFASCRTVYAAQNEVLNKFVCDSLFAHANPCSYIYTLGDAIRLGKNASPRDENNLPYVLLGDPALFLRYPTDYQVSTTIAPDTIRALSTNTIDGCILTGDNDTATWFNGKVHVTVLDKMQTLYTLDNDQPNADNKSIYEFVDYPNTLFKGVASVENGKFSCTFMMPRDIKYNYGKARIVYYAQDTINFEEANGYYENFVVGGSSNALQADSIGPELHLYLNNSAFTNGGKTHEKPHFFAHIADESGINTVGSGIGHDLMLMLDNDPNLTYVVNDYFTAQTNSYQAGLVSFPLTELTEGTHTLSFRAWDLLNNSSTATLDFEVVKGYQPQIFSVITYPNPVSSDSMITISVQHDRPDDLLQVRFLVYDLAGRKVWEVTEKGNGTTTFNPSDANMIPGIYVYRVQIKTSDSTYTSQAGKIMVF